VAATGIVKSSGEMTSAGSGDNSIEAACIAPAYGALAASASSAQRYQSA